jgi:hypothetical protein
MLWSTYLFWCILMGFIMPFSYRYVTDFDHSDPSQYESSTKWDHFISLSFDDQKSNHNYPEEKSTFKDGSCAASILHQPTTPSPYLPALPTVLVFNVNLERRNSVFLKQSSNHSKPSTKTF